MKKNIIVSLALLVNSFFCFSQDFIEKNCSLEINKSIKLYGTLVTPKDNSKKTICLIIAGSGPTDRNGNSPGIVNNSLKFLAEDLADLGVASLRYDKRGVAASSESVTEESKMRFDDLVNDAFSWIEEIKRDTNFNKIIIIGHSEGSLIGAITSQKVAVDGFVSISGCASNVSDILKKQLASQSEQIKKETFAIIDELKKGNLVKDIKPEYASLFRESVQPYMISWFKYTPKDEFLKLNCKTLIINGKKDLQVDILEANELAKYSKNSTLKIFDNMNHIMKEVSDNINENYSSYYTTENRILREVSDTIFKFIATL